EPDGGSVVPKKSALASDVPAEEDRKAAQLSVFGRISASEAEWPKAKCTTPLRSSAFCTTGNEDNSRTKLVGHEPVELQGLSCCGCVVDLDEGSDRLRSDILHFCPWPVSDGGSALETVGLGL